MDITEVVRGEDLLLSTAQQLYVMSRLGLNAPRHYLHFPLVRNSTGVRLSKRDQSLSMEQLRRAHTPEKVIAMALSAANVPLGVMSDLRHQGV